MWLVLLLLGCSGTDEAPVEPVFVRDGVIGAAGEGGRALGDGRALYERSWTAGEAVAIGGVEAVAPGRAECVPLYSVPLGDVSRLIASGGEPPDTAMAFSPDGARLAIGAYTGEIVVVDAWTGAPIARRRLSEALVKQVAWARDGQTLYAAEQSADALLHALDPTTLQDRWTVRLADDVGSSPPPEGDDLYGVYQLPGVFGLHVFPDGDLLVSAVHGWVDTDGKRRNQSRLIRFGADATRKAAFPEQGAADATLFYPRVQGDRVVVPVGRSADGPAPDLPIDGVLVLDARSLQPRGRFVAEPLQPYFQRVFVWQGVDVDGETVLTGVGDGRVMLWNETGVSPSLTLDLGTPVLAGDVPISASVGFAELVQGGFVTLTSGTNIPYGAADPALRPPAAHPNANAVWMHDRQGQLRWTWTGPHAVQGLTVSPDEDELVVGGGPRSADDRRDLFGALVFRLGGEGSGEERLTAFCATAGPVFFRHALAEDGRVAVSEHPTVASDGTVQGVYRVTVLR